MIVGNKFSPRVHSTYPYQQKSRFHPKWIENKTRKTIFFLWNWNSTENCLQTTYHPSFMVHWWVLVHCGHLVQVLNANKAYTMCTPYTKWGEKKKSTFCWLPIRSPILINISILISKFVSFEPKGREGQLLNLQVLRNSNTKRKEMMQRE